MKTKFSAEKENHLEAYKAMALEGISDGVMICSMDQRGATIAYVNLAYEIITGYKASEIIGKKPNFLANGDLDQPGIRELRHALSEQKAARVLLRNYRKNGQLFWNSLSVSPFFDAHDQLTHYFGVLNDCTSKKMADDQIMAALHRMDTLGSLSAEGLLTFDAARKVTYVNNTFLEFTGLHKEEVMDCDIRNFDLLFETACCDKSITGIFNFNVSHDDDLFASQEIEIKYPQRRILERKIRQSPYDALLAVYYLDITQKKEIELLKSEFMATAAHELRTPMSSILGFSELLLVHEFERTDQKEMLTIIAEQARRINGMLNELLDLEKIEARQGMDFDLKIHDLRQIVENVTDSFATSCSNFTLEFPTEPLLANIDQAKIIQALNNLISNAIKFSPKDAPIHIASTIKTCQIGSRISISIHDCGIGMTPDQVAHMGERFYRADTSGRVLGTGLGVALVMEIAKFHGGSLKIKSQLGAGSSFTLELPHIASNEIETIQ